MAKKTYYFPHDANARNDEKLLAVRMKLGMEGYGIYFALIEKLLESTDYILLKDYNTIAFELRVGAEKIKSIVEDYGLFQFTEDGKLFYSESLKQRMNPLEETREKRSEAGKKGAEKRWGKGQKMANAIKSDSKPMANAIDKNSRVEESKVKKSKEDKTSNIPPTPPKGDQLSKKLSELEKKEAALNKLETELKAKEEKLNAGGAEKKPKKEADPLNKEARNVFEDHYRETYDADYYWTAKDAGCMTRLLNKIKDSRKKRGQSIENNEVLFALKAFLSSIGNSWLLENFSVPKIDSNYNEIVAQAKSRKNEQTGNSKNIAKYRSGNGNTPGRTDAERKKAERDHLGELANAILQQSAAKNGE